MTSRLVPPPLVASSTALVVVVVSIVWQRNDSGTAMSVVVTPAVWGVGRSHPLLSSSSPQVVHPPPLIVFSTTCPPRNDIAATDVTTFPPSLPALKVPSNVCSHSRQHKGMIATAAVATVIAAFSPSPLHDNFNPCKDAPTAHLLA